MPELGLPRAVSADQLPPQMAALERAEQAEVAALLAQLEEQGLYDEALALQTNYRNDLSNRRAQMIREGIVTPTSQGLAEGINSAVGGAGRALANFYSQRAQDIVGLGQSVGNRFLNQTNGLADAIVDPIERAEAQLQEAQSTQAILEGQPAEALAPTPAPAVVPALPAPAPAQAPAVVPFESAAALDQLRGITEFADAQARGEEQAVLQNMVATDELRRNADLANSLLTPQVIANPLLAASAGLPQPGTAPATFNALTPLTQRVAPTPEAASLQPALARNAQNQIQQAALFQRLSAQEVARLEALKEQSALAERDLAANARLFAEQIARPILSQPR